ncbi:MAG TPA: glucokinase [Myxococcales bacterium]|nr:glucokinase [Myxococcales bacterium]
MEVLAGDIGGTKTLLAVAEVAAGQPSSGLRIDLKSERRYESAKYPGLAAICQEYQRAEGGKLPAHAGFGVAGPVKNGRSQTTNLPWILDERDLARTLGFLTVRLANDFHALALGIPALGQAHLVTLQEGARDPLGPCALIGAGTGLGEAVLVPAGGPRYTVIATEGGHNDFAPRDETEIGILRFLLRRYQHVSWERVLSGDGIVNLAEALAEITRTPIPERIALAIASDRASAPALITSAAEDDPLCRRVLETFASIYGAEAGNLALKTLATGGVYIAGGIAPKVLPFLTDGRFRESFLAKGRMRHLLEAMPVSIMLQSDAALLGAAALAAHAATESREGRHMQATEQGAQ